MVGWNVRASHAPVRDPEGIRVEAGRPPEQRVEDTYGRIDHRHPPGLLLYALEEHTCSCRHLGRGQPIGNFEIDDRRQVARLRAARDLDEEIGLSNWIGLRPEEVIRAVNNSIGSRIRPVGRKVIIDERRTLGRLDDRESDSSPPGGPPVDRPVKWETSTPLIVGPVAQEVTSSSTESISGERSAHPASVAMASSRAIGS